MQNTSTDPAGEAASFSTNIANALVANSATEFGVFGGSGTRTGVLGVTNSGSLGVEGKTNSVANDTAGVRGRDGTILDDIAGLPSAGVRGVSLHVGVLGVSHSGIAVQGATDIGSAAVRGDNSSSANNRPAYSASMARGSSG